MVGFLFSQEEGEKSEVVISLPPEDTVRKGFMDRPERGPDGGTKQPAP